MRLEIFLCCLGMFGCQQHAHSRDEALLRMQMTAQTQVVLFSVDQDGGISYGGGYDAVEGNTTWEGILSESQRLKLDDLIESGSWLTRSNGTQIRDETPHYSIRVHRGTTRSFDLPITDSVGMAIFELLSDAALVRFDPYLNSLPKPNMDTIVDRKLKEKSIESK